MQVTIEIPDPPAGCDPAAVKWGVPPKGAFYFQATMGQWVGPNDGKVFLQNTAWVMPYTPSFLGLLEPGWVTHDEAFGWLSHADRPMWNLGCEGFWHSDSVEETRLPFREVPPISGEQAIWEVPSE